MFSNIGEVKLYYLKTNYDNLARQGSDAWLEGRKGRFGGSEIGQITEKNKKLGDKLIENKVNQIFVSNLFCWWGTTFEPIAKSYLEFKDGYKIHEFGAVPCSVYPVAYSPDGVYINPKDNDLWLLEIKCPFLRNVDSTTDIKRHYYLQVQMGMSILPITSCNFVQFKFRRCKHYHMDHEGKYDRKFHQELKRSKEQKELWKGALYWKTTDGVREDFDMTKPPTIVYKSFETPDFFELCESYDTGILMYFKCFYVNEMTINKNSGSISQYNRHIWDRFRQLIDLQNKNQMSSKN